MRREATSDHMLAKVAGTLPSGLSLRVEDRVPPALAFLALLCALLLSPGCSQVSGQSEEAAVSKGAGAVSSDDIARLQVLPADTTTGDMPVQRIDLGSIRQGASVSRTVIIENRTLEPVTIDRFESSCECLTLSALPLTVSPHGSAPIRVAADESREPEFHGDLAIDVSAFAAGSLLMRFQAYLSVRKDEAAGSGTNSGATPHLGASTSFDLFHSTRQFGRAGFGATGSGRA